MLVSLCLDAGRPGGREPARGAVGTGRGIRSLPPNQGGLWVEA